MKGRIVLTVLVFWLSACTVGPNYVAPHKSIKAQRWAAHSKAENLPLHTGQADTQWWKNFNDPLLTDYIAIASTNNLDLRISQQRLLKARALRESIHGQSGPSVIANSSVTNEHVSKNGRILGSLPANTFPEVALIPLTRTVYNPGFDAAWELDVFGQLQRRDQEQAANTQAALANVADTLRQIRAELARSYFDLRANQQRAVILSKTIALQQEALRLTKQQQQEGAVNQSSLELLQSQLQTTKAQMPALQAQNWALAVQIGILLGQEASDVWPQLSKPQALAAIPKNIAVGLPSDLLRRRPDIARAERGIAAATAQVGVNVADLYPKFNLVANSALESLSLNTLWRSQSATWVIGPFMQWSIFQSGRIRANIRMSKAALQEAVLDYKKTVLAALGEAETALNGFINAQRSSRMSQAALRANQRNQSLAQQRFTEGEDDKLSLINTKQAYLNAQTNAVNASHSTLIQLVRVYKAVGGEWSS